MIDVDDVQHFDPQDGEVFVLPVGVSFEEAERFGRAIQQAKPHVRAIVVIGDIQHLSESAMNRAGWYRK